MTEIAGVKLVEMLAKAVMARLTDVEKINREMPALQDSLPEKLKHHLRMLCSWAEHLEVVDAREPKQVESNTLPIHLNVPRRLRSPQDSDQAECEELDLLRSPGKHFLVLGGPGSGKTTLLKRVARHLMIGQSDSMDTHQYPLLIRLRALLKAENSIPVILANVLGIKFEIYKVPDRETGRDIISYQVLGRSLEGVIAEFLDETGAVVLLDGLDEVDPDMRPTIERSIEQLSELLHSASIILTCRTGYSTALLAHFTKLEMCGLEPSQVEQLAGLWLKDPRGFLDSLHHAPYSDLRSRPLFLTQLMIHFSNYGFLPEAPKDVYSRVCRLAIEEWDYKRLIRRSTSYSGFHTEAKMRFLSALAYELTYTSRVARFSREAMESAYDTIYSDFGLPRESCNHVLDELEGHTGILVGSGYRHFEFSHLSLQEYLSAEWIIRSALSSSDIASLLAVNPAPIAVAVGVSSDSSRWLGNLLLSATIRDEWVAPFLARILDEAPIFKSSLVLGCGLIRLVIMSSATVWPHLAATLRTEPEAVKSVQRAMFYYVASKERDSWTLRRRSDGDQLEFRIPIGGRIDAKVFKELLAAARVQVSKMAGESQSYELRPLTAG